MTKTPDQSLAQKVLKIDRAVLAEAVDGWLQTTSAANWGMSYDIVKPENRAPAVETILDALYGSFGYLIEPDQAWIARNEGLARVVAEVAARYRDESRPDSIGNPQPDNFEDDREKADSPSTLRHTLGDPSEG